MILRTIAIRMEGEPPLTRHQLLARASDALKAAHERARIKSSFKKLVAMAESLLESGDLKAWQLELVTLDDSAASFVRVSVAYWIAARDALNGDNHAEFTYAIAKCYYYLGAASGPVTFKEQSGTGGTATAQKRQGDQRKAVLEWLGKQDPRSFASMRGAIDEMVRLEIVSGEGDVARALYEWSRKSQVARKAFARVSRRKLPAN